MTPARGRRSLPLLFVAVCATLVLALGLSWAHDRMAPWSEPRFEPAQFVAVGPPPAIDGARELWLIAVNPLCPHCRQHLARAAAALPRGSGTRLGILLVDTPKLPAAPAFANVVVDGMWWDVRDTWRRRWGHRVYGEVLVFDGGGRYLRTLPPGFESAP